MGLKVVFLMLLCFRCISNAQNNQGEDASTWTQAGSEVFLICYHHPVTIDCKQSCLISKECNNGRALQRCLQSPGQDDFHGPKRSIQKKKARQPLNELLKIQPHSFLLWFSNKSFNTRSHSPLRSTDSLFTRLDSEGVRALNTKYRDEK